MSVETISRLLEHLREERSTSPRLIWYGPGAERVELSGRVLDNWVAKTSNYLVDELDAGTGSTVLLDLAPHWRSLCWALAAWQVGAQVLLPADNEHAGGSDVIVTTTPDRWADSAPPQFLVAVALPALQMNWDGPLPNGALDYAGEVRSHADVYLGLDEPAPGDTALSFDRTSVSYADLVATEAADTDPIEPSDTVLLTADAPLAEVLRASLHAWAVDGAVVLVHPEVEVTQRLLDGERITRRYGGARGQ